MIDELRKEIDGLDAELVRTLAKRMELALQLGREKKAAGVEIHQKTREMTVLDSAKLMADSLGLSDAFIADIYSLIFAESRRLQSGA
jgi:chorismate mutase